MIWWIKYVPLIAGLNNNKSNGEKMYRMCVEEYASSERKKKHIKKCDEYIYMFYVYFRKTFFHLHF